MEGTLLTTFESHLVYYNLPPLILVLSSRGGQASSVGRAISRDFLSISVFFCSLLFMLVYIELGMVCVSYSIRVIKFIARAMVNLI